MSKIQNALLAWHDRWANKHRIIVLALIYPIFPVVLLPWVGDVGGAPILDLHLHYDAEVVRQVLLQYNASALEHYRLCALTVDMVYPVYYAFLLSLVLAYLVKQGGETQSSMRLICVIPFLMMLVDWAENLTLVSIVNQWPNLDYQLANGAGFITLAKWLLLSVIVVLIIMLAFRNNRAGSKI